MPVNPYEGAASSVKLLLDGRSNAVQMPVNPYEGGASSARLRLQQGKITPIAATCEVLMSFNMFDIGDEYRGEHRQIALRI